MKRKSNTILLVAIVFVLCFYAFRFARDNGFFDKKESPIEYVNDDYADVATEDLDTASADSVPTTEQPSSSAPSSTGSYSTNHSSGRHFDDGYEHGLEDGEDDADHSRYNARSRRGGDYDRGYQYGYEEAEEDDEWEDDGGDPFDE